MKSFDESLTEEHEAEMRWNEYNERMMFDQLASAEKRVKGVSNSGDGMMVAGDVNLTMMSPPSSRNGSAPDRQPPPGEPSLLSKMLPFIVSAGLGGGGFAIADYFMGTDKPPTVENPVNDMTGTLQKDV